MSAPTFLPEHFINRELSWLEFNARVLEEAQDASNPLLERAKFLGIFASNLDEFFMVRVAGLREQAFGALPPQDPPTDGLSPLSQLQRIAFRVRQLVEQQYECWTASVRPALAAEGVRIHVEADLTPAQRKNLDKFFRQRAFPVLTPMAIDPSHPSPRFHNRGLYLAATLRRTHGIGPGRMFAVVQLPQVLPRYVPIDPESLTDFIRLEEVVAGRLPELFGGYQIVNVGAFRITRDQDVDLLDEEGDDMLRAIEGRLRARQRSEAVRLEVSADMPPELLSLLVEEEQLKRGADGGYNEVYPVNGPLDMTGLFELIGQVERPDLRDDPFAAKVEPELREDADLFASIAKRDFLLHHPFDSFRPVVDFVQRAARDPDVLAIKQTLYRTSGDSPIVSALIEAAENGKHVTALVELKARFDEANNISWARRLEQAGVHVVFGFMDLKTHCKLALVVRQEGKKTRRYAHLGTGNYNPTTARIYTDLGLFTADKVMTEDVAAVFNFLTGYSQDHAWQRLVVAPQDLHRRTLELIDEQTQRAAAGKPARIFAKLNALVDRPTIEALYRASGAGVPIDLVVRGVCSLRPGLSGLSENIRVRSIVDRFLEHSRLFVFGEGEDQRVYLSSADWMPRNFERRVEVMFPVEAPELKRRIVEEIIPAQLRDNQRARELSADGGYSRVSAAAGQVAIRSQHVLLGQTPVEAVPGPAPPGSTAPVPAAKPSERKSKPGRKQGEQKSLSHGKHKADRNGSDKSRDKNPDKTGKRGSRAAK
ncbi:polyphosphate kinase 1 [Pirellulimonas nuda]|nr:polyphosphate kinase 1 [Pirellulimonas nuda]